MTCSGFSPSESGVLMEPTLIATVSDPSQTAELYVAGPQKKAIAAALLLTWRYAIDPNLLVLFRGRPGQGNHGGLARAVCGVARGAELAKDAGGRYLGVMSESFSTKCWNQYWRSYNTTSWLHSLDLSLFVIECQHHRFSVCSQSPARFSNRWLSYPYTSINALGIDGKRGIPILVRRLGDRHGGFDDARHVDSAVYAAELGHRPGDPVIDRLRPTHIDHGVNVLFACCSAAGLGQRCCRRLEGLLVYVGQRDDGAPRCE